VAALIDAGGRRRTPCTVSSKFPRDPCARAKAPCGGVVPSIDLNRKEITMAITPNKDQVKGELKDLGGKIQEEAGKLTGNKKQEAKGLQKQAAGKLQKGVGNLKEAVSDAVQKA